MKHKNCGGNIRTGEYRYTYEHEDGTEEFIPVYFCDKCDKEILGNREVEINEG